MLRLGKFEAGLRSARGRCMWLSSRRKRRLLWGTGQHYLSPLATICLLPRIYCLFSICNNGPVSWILTFHDSRVLKLQAHLSRKYEVKRGEGFRNKASEDQSFSKAIFRLALPRRSLVRRKTIFIRRSMCDQCTIITLDREIGSDQLIFHHYTYSSSCRLCRSLIC